METQHVRTLIADLTIPSEARPAALSILAYHGVDVKFLQDGHRLSIHQQPNPIAKCAAEILQATKVRGMILQYPELGDGSLKFRDWPEFSRSGSSQPEDQADLNRAAEEWNATA